MTRLLLPSLAPFFYHAAQAGASEATQRGCELRGSSIQVAGKFFSSFAQIANDFFSELEILSQAEQIVRYQQATPDRLEN